MNYKLYNILGINKYYFQNEIDLVYKKHKEYYFIYDDINYLEILMAYSILSNEYERLKYDYLGDELYYKKQSLDDIILYHNRNKYIYSNKYKENINIYYDDDYYFNFYKKINFKK